MTPDPQTFFDVLNPDDTSTGGGSASAIAGGMAASLLAMACLLSFKSPDDSESFFREKSEIARALSSNLMDGAAHDTQAFQSIRAAFRLPKETDEQRQARQQAIQEAWFEAAHVPLENALCCLQVHNLCLELADRINPNVRSDLNCAIHLSRAGLLGCLENVSINLPNIKDLALNLQLSQQAAQLRANLNSLETNQSAKSGE